MVCCTRGHTVAMFASSLGDSLIAVGILVIAVGSFALSRRIQPFWVSRDGQRFITVGRELDHLDEPKGARRDVHGGFDGSRLIVKVRRGARGRRSQYQVTERRRLDDNAWWYVLRSTDSPDDLPAVATRVPVDSPIAARLDELREASDR